MSSPPTLAWAQSLVGKDWEIYWENSDESEEEAGTSLQTQQAASSKNNLATPLQTTTFPPILENSFGLGNYNSYGLQQMQMMGVPYSAGMYPPAMMNPTGIYPPPMMMPDSSMMPTSSMFPGHSLDALDGEIAIMPQAAADEKTENPNANADTEGMISDWYDGRVLRFQRVGVDAFEFEIEYVGDDEIHRERLAPTTVRPSARAWLLRSRAILNAEGPDAELPVDTADMSDYGALRNIRQSIEEEVNFEPLHNVTGSESVASVSPKEAKQMMELQYNVRAQIHLRNKLAKIEDIGEKTEDEPSKAYVNHLVKCLERLNTACEWYKKCWTIHREVMNPFTDRPRRIGVEFIQKDCVECGRDEVLSLMNMDSSLSGSKKNPVLVTSSSSNRRTKRRRLQKSPAEMIAAPGTTISEDDEDLEEGGCVSWIAIKKFSERVESEDGRWYVKATLSMLRSLSFHIHEPLATWIRDADHVLGERQDESEDDISGVTSVGESTEEQGTGCHDRNPKMYSHQDVDLIMLKTSTITVLANIDVSRWQSKLKRKLDDIAGFEAEAWRLMSLLDDEASMATRDSDIILGGLTRLKEQLQSVDSSVFNVDPLAKSPMSRLTRDVIEKAVHVRSWIVDLVQAEKRRERVMFVQDVVARAPTLPQLPPPPGDPSGSLSLASRLATVTARVQAVSSKLYSSLQVISEYEHRLAESVVPTSDSFGGLREIDDVIEALSVLSALPVLSVVEEKLSVRLDILTWTADAIPLLAKEKGDLSFEEMERHHNQLMDILKGESRRRMALMNMLVNRETVDKQIRQFARHDVDNMTSQVGPTMEALFQHSNAWKERADAIVYSLQIHGNDISGLPPKSGKSPGTKVAMVDGKRMVDLLKDYGALRVSLMNQVRGIEAVYDETKAWSFRVANAIENDQDLLRSLTQCRDSRPKGVIVDPSRHVLDSIIELLHWHHRMKSAVSSLRVNIASVDLYALIIEGMEVVERHSRDVRHFKFNRDEMRTNLLSRVSQRPTKGIVLAKLEAASAAQLVFQRLISSRFDDAEGGPIFAASYIVWAATVSEFVESVVREGVEKRPTLTTALALLNEEPKSDAIVQPRECLLDRDLDDALSRLTTLKTEWLSNENTARTLLVPNKDMFRGSSKRIEQVKEYLASLKAIQTKLKGPRQGGKGLVLDMALEKPIDQLIKEVSWLVRTLAYPILHDDNIEVESTQRLPWNVLVGLHERLASIKDTQLGDIPRVRLRVMELHDAASNWQKEVSSLLDLSIRGAKRRHAGLQDSSEVDGQEGHPAQINNNKLAELVKDPILQKISIPRENSVRDVLAKMFEFEKQFYQLLGEDFTGDEPDKAPYPVSSSLVAMNGDFLLFRLTESPLFAALRESIRNMTQIGADIAADTPAKEAFDWIQKCVQWIESLKDTVTLESPFGNVQRLVVQADDAARLVKIGSELFLSITDGIKKTLSSFKITISTNKQSERITITIAKGGAHHSTGGTAIKWCPLILDWLKSDLEKNKEWNRRSAESLNLFRISINPKLNQPPPVSLTQEDLNEAFQCLDDLKHLFHHEADLLVVVPSRKMVDAMQLVIDTVQQTIDEKVKLSDGTLKLDHARIKRYEDLNSVIRDKNSFLSALLSRRRVKDKSTIVRITEKTPKRTRAADKVEKALKKGVRMMGLPIEGDDVGLHCAVKAWEIESAVHSQYQADAEYATKLNSLIKNIEDTNNPTLCPRVLTNDLQVSRFVSLPSEELANKQVRARRAKAEAESRKNIVVAGSGKVKSPKSTKSVKTLLKSTGLSPPFSPKLLKPPPAFSHGITTPLSAGTLSESDSQSIDPMVIAAAVQRLQPIPPPPLVAPTVTSPRPISRLEETLVSKSGGRVFTISVNPPKATFQAKLFVTDSNSPPGIQRFLPETMKQSGRSKMDEFKHFVSKKSRSGNSTIVVFRVSVTDGHHDFRRFRAEYERIDRIAMFKLTDGDILFLVTPKFGKQAKETRCLPQGETYVIIISKTL